MTEFLIRFQSIRDDPDNDARLVHLAIESGGQAGMILVAVPRPVLQLWLGSSTVVGSPSDAVWLAADALRAWTMQGLMADEELREPAAHLRNVVSPADLARVEHPSDLVSPDLREGTVLLSFEH